MTGDPAWTVGIPAAGCELSGQLWVPAGAAGIAVFAHGSGSGGNSARDRFVARALQRRRSGSSSRPCNTRRSAFLGLVEQ
jgi:hypothetical protein